jgi:hypothetical protein
MGSVIVRENLGGSIGGRTGRVKRRSGSADHDRGGGDAKSCIPGADRVQKGHHPPEGRSPPMAKGQEKPQTKNKPKLTIKEKKQKKKEKAAGK